MQIAAFLSLLRCPCACALLYMPLFSLAVWLYVHASRVDTAAVSAAVSCAALAVSVWLYIVRCAVMCYMDCRCTCPAPFPVLAAHKATADTAL